MYFYKDQIISNSSASFVYLFVVYSISLYIVKPAYSLRRGKNYAKGVMHMDGKELAKQTLDQIPQTNVNAKRIVGLVKKGGRITGYQLSDNSIV